MNIPLLLRPLSVDGHEIEMAELLGEEQDRSAAIIHLHGKGGNFYSLPFRSLAPRLGPGMPVSYSLNMRSHDIGYSRGDLPAEDFPTGGDIAVSGGAWEDLNTGWRDLEIAVEYVLAAGARRVYFVGHSSGAFYAVDYAARRGADVPLAGLVLCSALTSNRMSLHRWFPDEEERERVRAQARAMQASGHGNQLIPLPAWYGAISADSLLQRERESPDHFARALSGVDAPVEFVWGAQESRASQWRTLAEGHPRGSWTELSETDHHYLGAERAFARSVEKFVSRTR
ncbi:alpha/beta fold hydrolase [Microbacterium sp. NPDC058342]|uniref:alpha/beta fold hydrolase n=1 Tax=Microbacterium sp. NPDC058342 TaxID=3346454 RepID=UPI003661F8A8